MDHFYQSIEGCFTFAEFYRFVARSPEPGWRGVEVGALFGQSAAYLACELASDFPENRMQPLLDLVELSPHRDRLAANLAPVAKWLGEIHSPMSSVDASKLYADDSLDFVMLDAGHTLEEVRSDIAHWWPKVRVGGILSGHDFSHYFPGVMRAALEAFPRLSVWGGSLWPDETVHGQRLVDAQNDIRNRSAAGEVDDFHPVWWVRK